MILEALYRYYQRIEAELPPPGYSNELIEFLLTVNEDGKLVSIEDVRSETRGALRGRSFVVPARPRTSDIVPGMLWDNAEYVLGLLTHGHRAQVLERKGEAGANTYASKHVGQAHQAFRQAVAELAAATDDPGVLAVCRFLERDVRTEIAGHQTWSDIDAGNYNLAFRLLGDGALVCQRPAVRAALTERFDNDSDAPQVQCLVTGERHSLGRLHPNVRGIFGGRSSGVSLVSFNFAAAESFGKSKGAIAPVGKPVVFGYTTALQALIRDAHHRVRCGDSTVLFWSEQPHPVEAAFADWFNPPADDPAENVEHVASLYTSPWTGEGAESHSVTQFFILGLSPNAGRQVVRFWHRGTTDEVAARFRQHFADLEVVRAPYEPHYLPIWRLLKSVAPRGQLDRLPPNLGGEILAAIIKGTPYPRTFLMLAIQRALKERDIDYPRAALIKAVLARYTRIHNPQHNEVDIMLDEENNNVGYCLGRLFALLERVQQQANPGIKTTIRGRYYNSAATRPLTIFTRLMDLKNHHLDKIGQERAGLKHWFEQRIDAVVAQIDDVPRQLALEDQGRFAIGYHHQRHALYQRADKGDVQLTTDNVNSVEEENA